MSTLELKMPESSSEQIQINQRFVNLSFHERKVLAGSRLVRLLGGLFACADAHDWDRHFSMKWALEDGLGRYRGYRKLFNDHAGDYRQMLETSEAKAFSVRREEQEWFEYLLELNRYRVSAGYWPLERYKCMTGRAFEHYFSACRFGFSVFDTVDLASTGEILRIKDDAELWLAENYPQLVDEKRTVDTVSAS